MYLNAVNTKEASRQPRGTPGLPAPAPWQPSVASSSNKGEPAGGLPPSKLATRGLQAEAAVSSRGRARTRGRPRRLTANSSSRTGVGPSRRRERPGMGGTTGPRPSFSKWLLVATEATGTRLVLGTGNGWLNYVYECLSKTNTNYFQRSWYLKNVVNK